MRGMHGLVQVIASGSSPRPSFTAIDNLLCTLRSGQIKNAVDEGTTACSVPFDLLDSIETSRQTAVEATDEVDKKKLAGRDLARAC